MDTMSVLKIYVVNSYSIDKIKSVLKSFSPNVIGANGVTMNINNSLSILKDCREQMPGVITVMGGPHVTFDADNILGDHDYIDFIVRREGEITFHELLKTIDSKKQYKDILGLSYREGSTILHNPDRPFIADINILPNHDYSLVQLSKYKALGTSVNMITSRGCPFKCIFCVGSKMVGHKVRYYNIDRVVNEFESLSKLGFKQINFADDLFTSNRKRCIAICNEIIKRGIDHKWTAFARVDTVTEELLTAMKNAGCTTLCFGIESGDQEILNTIKKKTTLKVIGEAIELCGNAGIDAMASYILGLPGETPETVKRTMSFAKQLCSSYGYHILAPFPGTEVRERSSHYGISLLTDEWDKYDANRSVCETVSLPHSEVDRIVEEFNSKIHENVKIIFERFKRNEELSDFENEIVSNITSFLFVQELIEKDILDRFHCRNGRDKKLLYGEAKQYILENTSFSKEEVSSEFDRLLGLNCITANEISGTMSIDWC